MVHKVCCFLIASVVLIGCDSRRQNDAWYEEVVRRANEQSQALRELASRHGADWEWDKPLKDLRHLYTLDLQRALIKPRGQPVVFAGVVDDVVEVEPNRYEVWFDCSSALRPDLRVVLSLDSDHVRPLLEKKKDEFPDQKFAFVARVTRVWKPALEMSAEPPDEAGYSPYIVVGAPGTLFAKADGLEVVLLRR